MVSQLLIYQRVRRCANLFWSDLASRVRKEEGNTDGVMLPDSRCDPCYKLLCLPGRKEGVVEP